MLRSTEYYCEWIICIRCLREGFSVLLTGTNALCFQQYQKEKHAGNPCLNKHAGNLCLNKHAGNPCLNYFWKVIWKEVNIIFWGSKWDLMNLILCWVCFCDFCNISLLQLSPLILRDKIKFYIKVPPKGINTKMFSNSPSITRFQIHFK
jgi:hypothetical protein